MADQERHQLRGGSGRNPGQSGAGSAAAFAGLGLQMAISIVLFLYVGRWLDTKLGTEPLLLIIGVFVGAALGIYNMYHVLTGAQRKAQDENDK